MMWAVDVIKSTRKNIRVTTAIGQEDGGLLYNMQLYPLNFAFSLKNIMITTAIGQ